MTRRRVLSLSAAGTLAVLAAGGGVFTARDDSTAAASDEAETRTATARITRRNLVRRESFDGTLGYADVRTLAASSPGTVTRLRREGAVVRRAGVLYEVNGQPVYLLYGAKPAWRRLARGVDDGRDVRQLEENLVAMGYDPDGDIAVDDEFDRATEAAVKRWEKDREVTADGAVELGEVVFLPGPRRVGAHRTTLGGNLQPGAEVMETTALRRVVTLNLDATRQALVRRGDRVEVELPDGRTVTGKIVRVGNVARSEPSEDGQEGEPYVEVIVTVSGAGSRFDQAPVDVNIAQEAKRGVLAVPVSALLALAGCGYAVEVDRGGARELVAVETGLYADGYVEISGKGIRAGLRVVVPR